MGDASYLCIMFVHKKRHRLGAYSIEVLRKDRYSRKNVPVKIIGTSSNVQELLALERKAREFIDTQLGQPIPMDYHYSLFSMPRNH